MARFLAEQTKQTVEFLSAQPGLLGVGSLVRHTVKTVVDTAMVLAPAVFHDDNHGQTVLVLSYRVVSLDDMKLGWAKSIKEVLVRAPAPWLPARLELWQPPTAAQEFLEQALAGHCFLRNEQLNALAIEHGVQVPERRDGVVEKLCSLAATACLEHLEAQLRGRVLYAIVPAGPARVLRLPLLPDERFLPRVEEPRFESRAGRAESAVASGSRGVAEANICSVLLGRGSKRAGEQCGKPMPCKRHEKQAATKAAAKPAARPPAAVAPRERQDVEGSHSAVGAGIRPVGTRCAIFSFFSGAGFMDLGFEREQFEVAFTIELSTRFCRAYKYSRERMGMPLPRFGCNKGDVSQIEHVTLRTRVERMRSEGKLVGFIGGPPCPDFSKAGKNLGESGDDGKLTGVYFDLILDMKPDFVVFENVDNLYREHRAYYESQKQKLEDTHWMTDKVVSCLELGVPQDRRRLILFGVCRDLLHHLHHDDLKSLEDEFWGGVPYPNASEAVDWPRVDEYLANGERPMPPGIQAYRSLTIEEWFLRNDVGNHANGEHFLKPKSQRIEKVQEGDVSRKSFKRPHRWRYAPTAAYGNNEVPLHPYKSRRMSAAEALAIQSLPKEFELPPDMPLTHMFKTIGNGLPFLAAKHFAGRVHAFLERVSVASSSSPPASST